MLRLASLLLVTVAVTLAALACGDDDDAGTPTPTAVTESPTATDGVTPGGQTTAAGDDLKTSPPDGSGGSVPPVATAPGDVPTAPPTASTGIPAVAPDDQGAFAGQFEGQVVEFETCAYNPTNGLVTCPQAEYRIDPPMVGQDISCTVWVVSGVREVVQCTSIEPTETIYYEIME